MSLKTNFIKLIIIVFKHNKIILKLENNKTKLLIKFENILNEIITNKQIKI